MKQISVSVLQFLLHMHILSCWMKYPINQKRLLSMMVKTQVTLPRIVILTFCHVSVHAKLLLLILTFYSEYIQAKTENRG